LPEQCACVPHNGLRLDSTALAAGRHSSRRMLTSPSPVLFPHIRAQVKVKYIRCARIVLRVSISAPNLNINTPSNPPFFPFFFPFQRPAARARCCCSCSCSSVLRKEEQRGRKRAGFRLREPLVGLCACTLRYVNWWAGWGLWWDWEDWEEV
jgi:hypothetical protein